MNINDAFPTDFLKAADLKGREFTLTIKHVESKELNDGTTKPTVYFLETDKGLGLNKTNAMTLSEMFGPETNTWSGQKVLLYTIKTNFQGQMVDAIRVRPPVAPGTVAPVAAPVSENPAAGLGADLNDDIPFAPW